VVPERIGPWRIRALESGSFRLDGGAMFGAIPKVLWSRTHPADDRNRIRMATRCLLLEGEGRRILVDTGLGTKMAAKQVDIFAVEPEPTLVSALAGAGLAPEDVTDVVLTHLHFDHAGGATRLAGGVPVPVFANARHYLQGRNYENALAPNVREAASYLHENFVPLMDAGLLTLWEGPQSPWPGIEIFTAEGHTRGQQLVRVAGPEGTVYFVADLIPTSGHVRIPYVMGFDVAPLESMEEKRALLSRASSEKAWVLLEHDRDVSWGRPKAIEGDFGWADTITAAGAAADP